MKYLPFFLLVVLFIPYQMNAQPSRWQQAAQYKMYIDFDTKTHRYKGDQTLVYTNNSPDTLNKVFYHLYFNAFQPNSMMDVRNRMLPDSDARVGERINSLNDTEIGYQTVQSLTQDGKPTQFAVVGTILEVALNTPILPGSSTTFIMKYEAQVPVQIRRSGRNNAEGVDYSMSQWYPKMCEYDYQGWHANPYVGREFYGIWGDFDVTINIDKDFIVAAGGELQNANAIGYGFQDKGTKQPKHRSKKIEWNYIAKNVHDFVWAADPDYTVDRMTADCGVEMYFVYQPNENTTENWKLLPNLMNKTFTYVNKNYGKYPYPVYYFIQGGDGGMEYPMATLITGERSLTSLTGVSVHELMHSWYQMILGTNEALYAWMDEGFTSYASTEVMNHLRSTKQLKDRDASANPFRGLVEGLAGFYASGLEEPLSVHGDHYKSNAAYGVGAYNKGQVFLRQLSSIIGKEAFDTGMLRYFNTWKFKHPNPNDFIRVMEKESGLELDWYKEYMVNTTHTIDYGVDTVIVGDNATNITLRKHGVFPMPIDIKITYEDGSSDMVNIPLRIMRGQKQVSSDYTIKEDWPWTHPTYNLVLDNSKSIKAVEIDPGFYFVDTDRVNNVWGEPSEE